MEVYLATISEDASGSQVQGHSVSEFGSIGGTRHFKSTTLPMI